MSKIIHQPNDKLFKLSMRELRVAQDFLKAHVPSALLKKMDLSRLKLENHSVVDEAYKTVEADIVYSIPLNNNPAYIYILCEQQTKVDSQMAFRLLVYMVRLMETHQRKNPKSNLPFIYPIVVYSGKKIWNASLEIFSLFGEQETLAREWFLKPYQLVDIHRMPDDELKKHTWCGLVEFALKYRKARDFMGFLKVFLPWLYQIETQKPEGLFLGKIILRYLMDGMTTQNVELLIEEVNHNPLTELREETMTIAQTLEKRGFAKGIHQGREEGIEQGKQEGKATFVMELLEQDFGALPADYVQQITQADSQTLLRWTRKASKAKTLEEVFED